MFRVPSGLWPKIWFNAQSYRSSTKCVRNYKQSVCAFEYAIFPPDVLQSYKVRLSLDPSNGRAMRGATR